MTIYTKIKGDGSVSPENLKELHDTIKSFMESKGLHTSVSICNAPENNKIVVVSQNGLPEDIYTNIDKCVLPPFSVCDLDEEDDFDSIETEEDPEEKETMEARLEAFNEAEEVRSDPAFHTI